MTKNIQYAHFCSTVCRRNSGAMVSTVSSQREYMTFLCGLLPSWVPSGFLPQYKGKLVSLTGPVWVWMVVYVLVLWHSGNLYRVYPASLHDSWALETPNWSRRRIQMELFSSCSMPHVNFADDLNHSINRKCARSSAWVPCFELKPNMGFNVPFNGCKLHFISLFEYYIITTFLICILTHTQPSKSAVSTDSIWSITGILYNSQILNWK